MAFIQHNGNIINLNFVSRIFVSKEIPITCPINLEINKENYRIMVVNAEGKNYIIDDNIKTEKEAKTIIADLFKNISY